MNRLSNWLQMVCALLCAGTAYASNCDPSLRNAPALYEVSVPIRGQNPVRNTFTVATNADLMVFAQERGADVTLEVLDSSGQSLGRGDNPIRRTAVQRVALSARAGQRFYIAVTGKDHADSKGWVDLRVIDLKNADDTACLEAQKLMAGADAAYAAGQAVTRSVAGKTQTTSSDEAYQRAADGYRKAAERFGNTPGILLRPQAELARATLFNTDVDNFVEARDWAAGAAESYAALHDDYGKARAQATESSAAIDLAVSARRAGTTDAAKQASAMLAQARDQLGAVAAFHTRRREIYEAAQAQNNIGMALYFAGSYDEALRAYHKSLPLYEGMHERAGQALVLQNMALMEWELGRMSTALPDFNKALALIKRDEEPQLYAAVLTNSALVNKAMGNDDLALRQLSESLEITRRIQDMSLQAADFHNIASVYATLGDQTRALEFFRQSLALATTTHNNRGRTASLRAIANILRQQGQAAEALKMDQEALSTAAAGAKVRITLQIARDLIELGRTKEAQQSLDAILSQNAPGDEVDRARALAERARIRSSAGDTDGAASDLNEALKTFKTYELPTDEFQVWLQLAQLERARSALPQAFAAVDQALALAEEVRLQSANPELRSTLLQPLRPAFDLKISMLSDQYRAAQGHQTEQASLALRALETAELARARAQADFQSLDLTAPGLDPKLLARRQGLYRELAARRSRLEARLDRSGTADAQSQAIRSDIAGLRQELDQIDARIGAASQSHSKRPSAAKRSGTTLPLGDIPADVAIVEYWLGEKSSFAWVVTRSAVTMMAIGPSLEINTEANALHTALRSFGTVSRADRLGAGERLYGRILRPIETQISDKHTLIFAPDGALHYVPFATLRSSDAGRKLFLVEQYDIAVTPSIQMFLQPAVSRPRAAGSQQMLLVDDPVYDAGDPRVRNPAAALGDIDPLDTTAAFAVVRGGEGHLPRLPGAAKEATAIAALMPAGSVDRLDGFAANRDRFLAASLDRYRLIHVATHATTDSEVPQASALILSTVDRVGKEIDGRVYAADFMGLRLQADTVVLSACDTALGKSVAGEGLIGLQYIVLARGARSVVSSLWPALDQVTAPLMVKFYTRLLEPRNTVIAAWSAASREALAGPYPDPATWGAFMLTLSHLEDIHSKTTQEEESHEPRR